MADPVTERLEPGAYGATEDDDPTPDELAAEEAAAAETARLMGLE